MGEGVWAPAFVMVVTTLIECGYSSHSLYQGAWFDTSAVNGCLLKPNVSRAVTMECDYGNIPFFMANLRAGQLPPSVRTIRIFNAKQLFVNRDTFSSLHSLQNIYIGDIQTVRIMKSNWSQIVQPDGVTITVDHVSQLIIDSGAFSGWSWPGPQIVIRNVTRCFVAASAFGPGSVLQKVTFEDIGRLWLKSGTFQADIDQLELHNVSLPDGCQDGFFGGRIGILSLSSVRMGEVYSGCLQADGGWGSLEVGLSSVGNIQGFGISGNIDDVIIEDSHLGCIKSSGLHVNASTFTVNRCHVRELVSDALDVQFSRSVSLKSSTITRIRANAFSRMRSHVGVASTVTLRRISVDTADARSLAFSEHTQPTLLDLVLPDSCECGVDQLALQLVVGDASPRNTTSKQRRAARQIVDEVRCLTGTDTPTLAEFHCQGCPAQDGSTARCSPPTSLVEKRTATWPSDGVVLLLPVVLLMAIGASAVVIRRRASRRRRESSSANFQRSNCREEAVAPEPVYSEIFENLQPHGRQTTSPAGAPSSMNRHRTLQPDPELESSEADAPRLPLPRVPSSLYLEMLPLPGTLQRQPVYANCDDTAQRQPLYEKCGGV